MVALPSDFLYAEKLISRSHDCSADLFQAIYEAARRLAPTDSFYLCWIERPDEQLRFVYHCDGDFYGPGNLVSFGGGPTTKVATTGRPVVMADESERNGLKMVPFGDEETQSAAAVHWPLRVSVDRDGLPDAVLSVQSYKGGVYSAEALAAVEWLALRAEQALRKA